MARDFNISEAKAELILQITDTDPTQNAESLSAMSVNELCAIYQSRNITNTNTVLSGSVSVKAYIGSDEALNIAVSYTNLHRGSAVFARHYGGVL